MEIVWNSKVKKVKIINKKSKLNWKIQNIKWEIANGRREMGKREQSEWHHDTIL